MCCAAQAPSPATAPPADLSHVMQIANAPVDADDVHLTEEDMNDPELLGEVRTSNTFPSSSLFSESLQFVTASFNDCVFYFPGALVHMIGLALSSHYVIFEIDAVIPLQQCLLKQHPFQYSVMELAQQFEAHRTLFQGLLMTERLQFDFSFTC